MKKLVAILALGGALAYMMSACKDDNTSTWESYRQWRDANQNWIAQQQARTNSDGTPYYEVVIPQWNPATFVLLHYVNDGSETVGNLSPLYNSTVDTRYTLHLYDGTGIDSSYFQTTYGPGIYRTQLNSVVQGWAAALMNMRCGDTVDVIIPYQLGYGTTYNNTIPPYSALAFGIRLVDIPKYEVTPY